MEPEWKQPIGDDGFGKRNDLKRRTCKRKKIAFFGSFGTGNLGNESTLQAIIYHLRRYIPDAEISCISTGPESTAAIHGIEAIPSEKIFFKSWAPRNRLLRLVRMICIGIPSEIYRWIRGVAALSRVNMLIIPGTGLLTDAYGLFSWGPYTLFKWSLIAKLCRCKLLFVSVGAGPLYRPLGRRLVKSALALADFRSYRDVSSKQYLKNIGFGTDSDRVYPDLVYSFPEARVPQREVRKSGRLVVGLGVMCHAAIIPRLSEKAYTEYLECLVSVASWLLARDHNIRLLVGDFCDASAVKGFKTLLKNRLPSCDEARIFDESVSSVEDLLSQFAATDVVVATRFHNVVLALINHKPVISISFHDKCASLMSEMGLSEYCLDINGLKAKELIERFCALEKNVDGLNLSIRAKIDERRTALEEQYNLVFTRC